MKARLLVSAAVALLGACSDDPIAFRCEGFEQFRIPISATPGDGGLGTATGADPLVETIASTFGTQTAENGQPAPSNILILSGGGQWGAFGAGFLHGWSQRGAAVGAPRPERFDVVTGVSTGSLQASFAFVGAEQDQALLDAYTITSERQLVRRRGGLFFLFHGSLADSRPLVQYVRRRLEGLIDRVAAPENEGRRLLVGVVDGLDGQMYAIDLTRIAREKSGPQRTDCYAAALLASSAVPAVFTQVTINGRPYLDGGVRQSVFASAVQNASGQALAAGNRRGNVYVLMNGDTAARRVDSLPPKLLPTIGRVRALVFNQIELNSIFNVAQSYPGMTTRLATAGGHQCDALPDEESEIFDPATMRCLRAYGEARWTGGNPWTEYHRPAN